MAHLMKLTVFIIIAILNCICVLARFVCTIADGYKFELVVLCVNFFHKYLEQHFTTIKKSDCLLK